jgi:catechol-2,3-dioxygenase
MLPIAGLYEVAIRVKDLRVAEDFYVNKLGLQEGLRDMRRNWLFLRAGGNAGMLVLQEDKGDWPTQHFAFTIGETDLEAAATALQKQGIEFSGPVLHDWMPAKSIYFDDPDGNQLELCAPIEAARQAGVRK